VGIIILFLVGIYVGIVIRIFVITTVLDNLFVEEFGSISKLGFAVSITTIFNMIILFFIHSIYDKVVITLTDFENLLTVQNYETNFVLKKYILYFVSYLGPLLIIAFLNYPFDLYCAKDYCLEHIKY